MEIWKDIKGYEGFYQVSNLGRVKSLDRVVITRSGRKKTIAQRILVNKRDTNGYLSVMLCKSGEVVQMRVHRLVACAFIENPNNLRCVNHKDANRKNNVVENLEWVTHRENTIHSIKVTKTFGTRDNRGSKNPNCRVNIDVVKNIRLDNENGMTHRELMIKYKLPSSTITNIKLYKTWNSDELK